jgi:hypothetical protein
VRRELRRARRLRVRRAGDDRDDRAREGGPHYFTGPIA